MNMMKQNFMQTVNGEVRRVSTVNIKINGYDYTMKKGITILDASFETLKMQREFMQQSIPTLYYLKGVAGCGSVRCLYRRGGW